MELQKLSDVFTNNEYEYLKLHYLYLHQKDSYPLKNEMDFENFFLVKEVLKDSIVVISILTGKETEFNFSELVGNWWVGLIPENIRKNFFPN